MRKVILIMAITSMLGGCFLDRNDDGAGAAADSTAVTAAADSVANPFFTDWDGPFGTPPFDRIKITDYEPAMIRAMAEHMDEIHAIARGPEFPDFANTIEALDGAGAALIRVGNVFGAMNGTMTGDEMQAIAKRLAPLRSKHRDEILLDPELFARIDAVYQRRDNLDLDPEQRMLLKETWKRFVRGGAKLPAADKQKLKDLNEELAVLSLQFGENVLKETNRFEMVIDNRDDLAGLPDAVIDAAAETAIKRGHPDKWVFTLHKPSLLPFLQYSTRRELRQEMFTGYTSVGNHDDELDNKALAARIASLREQRANLLGFPSHAAYVLDDNMAKTPQNVYDLLNQVWTPAVARAKSEAAEFQKMINRENRKADRFKLEPWDWWFYAEKVKKAKYDLDEAMLRPYFELENVRAGLFDTVNKLYGITFTPRSDIPVYQEDVKVYEVKDADGSTLAIWFSDYFPRESKRGGAWMSSFRKECYRDGRRVIPVVFNVGNFTRPTADTPALLSADEVSTMFHEFGHALHGMLSDCRYQTLSGTAVARDFVELPSQIMENWAFEPQVMAVYAKHYRTGEPIPDELVAKLDKSKHFNQGFATTEYLAASFLDMDWHTLESPEEKDVTVFEKESMDRIGLIPEIAPRYHTTYFRHVFSGSYSAGYYSYVWAEVLDADAFEAFKETGNIFDPATAKSFRDNILARGGSEEPMTLYRQFRGRDPEIGPLLARKGLD